MTVPLEDNFGNVTQDGFLGGKLKIMQPQRGYRSGMDAVFLAAAVPARPQEHLLDVGSGVGAAGLCVAYRVSDCSVTLLEREYISVALAAQNIQNNNLSHRVYAVQDDVQNPFSSLTSKMFHHVFSNPPYFEATALPSSSLKTSSHTHHASTLEGWVRFCSRMTKPYGTLTLVHRADHLAILCHLFHHHRFGDVTVMPLWPRAARNAHRILIQGTKGSRGASRLLPGILLQNNEGQTTPEADSIARQGNPILMTPLKGPSLKKEHGGPGRT